MATAAHCLDCDSSSYLKNGSAVITHMADCPSINGPADIAPATRCAGCSEPMLYGHIVHMRNCPELTEGA